MKKKKKTTFTVAEAAEYLGVSRQAVNDAVRFKRLRSKRQKVQKIVVREITMISKKDLDNFNVSRPHQRKGLLRKS